MQHACLYAEHIKIWISGEFPLRRALRIAGCPRKVIALGKLWTQENSQLRQKRFDELHVFRLVTVENIIVPASVKNFQLFWLLSRGIQQLRLMRIQQFVKTGVHDEGPPLEA